MNFIIHRGSHEIGGSCVELFCGTTRLLLDIGLPLKAPNSKPLSQLPDISGAYPDSIITSRPDAILISHAHQDHYGFVLYLKKEIPVYAGKAAKRLMELNFMLAGNPVKPDSFLTFESAKPFSIGCFIITPYLMDHSAFDAYAFLIEADGKKLFYSGDFRSHGRKERAFTWFIKHGPDKVDALLLEGTMLGRKQEAVKTEQQLEADVVELSKKTQGIVLAYASSQNIDRIVTFYRAAVRTGRQFVVDIYTAFILDQIGMLSKSIPHPSKEFKNLKVWFPGRLGTRIKETFGAEALYKFKSWKISPPELSEKGKGIILFVKPSVLRTLAKVENLEGGAFVYSLWGGYLKEPGTDRLVTYVKDRGMTFHANHTSGHAPERVLRQLAQKVKPGVVVPIHTEHPEEYAGMGAMVRLAGDGERVGV